MDSSGAVLWSSGARTLPADHSYHGFVFNPGTALIPGADYKLVMRFLTYALEVTSIGTCNGDPFPGGQLVLANTIDLGTLNSSWGHAFFTDVDTAFTATFEPSSSAPGLPAIALLALPAAGGILRKWRTR